MRSRFFDQVPRAVLGAVASLTLLLLTGIFTFLFTNGAGTFGKVSFADFFLSDNWNPTAYRQASWGILSLLAGTLLVGGLALAISVPCGFAVALYLSEIASPRSKEILKPLIEMVASIPSVVLGLLGIVFVAPAVATVFGLSNGLNAITAALLVAVAALPSIASICEDALSNVRYGYREASYALGATQWATIRRVVFPAARSGLLAGVMLGLGRVIGETVIVLMVAGNTRAFPKGLTSPVSPLTATVAIDIKEAVVGSLHWQSLFAIGGILFLLTFLINFAADLLIQRETET